jgi:hypothetical protein
MSRGGPLGWRQFASDPCRQAEFPFMRQPKRAQMSAMSAPWRALRQTAADTIRAVLAAEPEPPDVGAVFAFTASLPPG